MKSMRFHFINEILYIYELKIDSKMDIYFYT
jgi:hypothetical protein